MGDFVTGVAGVAGIGDFLVVIVEDLLVVAGVAGTGDFLVVGVEDFAVAGVSGIDDFLVTGVDLLALAGVSGIGEFVTGVAGVAGIGDFLVVRVQDHFIVAGVGRIKPDDWSYPNTLIINCFLYTAIDAPPQVSSTRMNPLRKH